MLLAVTAISVQEQHVGDFEIDVFHAINGLPGWLYVPVATVMQAGALVAVPVAALLASLWRKFRMALDLTVSGTLAWILAAVVKDIVGRERPAEILNEVVLRGTPASGQGYVSGHSAVAAALATAVSGFASRKIQIVVWVLAGIVALARVYVGAHLPLDVLGGMALGWVVGSLVHFLLGTPHPEEKR